MNNALSKINLNIGRLEGAIETMEMFGMPDPLKMAGFLRVEVEEVKILLSEIVSVCAVPADPAFQSPPPKTIGEIKLSALAHKGFEDYMKTDDAKVKKLGDEIREFVNTNDAEVSADSKEKKVVYKVGKKSKLTPEEKKEMQRVYSHRSYEKRKAEVADREKKINEVNANRIKNRNVGMRSFDTLKNEEVFTEPKKEEKPGEYKIEICKNKNCPKPEGRFIAGTGTTYKYFDTEIIFCSGNCKEDYLAKEF